MPFVSITECGVRSGRVKPLLRAMSDALAARGQLGLHILAFGPADVVQVALAARPTAFPSRLRDASWDHRRTCGAWESDEGRRHGWVTSRSLVTSPPRVVGLCHARLSRALRNDARLGRPVDLAYEGLLSRVRLPQGVVCAPLLGLDGADLHFLIGAETGDQIARTVACLRRLRLGAVLPSGCFGAGGPLLGREEAGLLRSTSTSVGLPVDAACLFLDQGPDAVMFQEGALARNIRFAPSEFGQLQVAADRLGGTGARIVGQFGHADAFIYPSGGVCLAPLSLNEMRAHFAAFLTEDPLDPSLDVESTLFYALPLDEVREVPGTGGWNRTAKLLYLRQQTELDSTKPDVMLQRWRRLVLHRGLPWSLGQGVGALIVDVASVAITEPEHFATLWPFVEAIVEMARPQGGRPGATASEIGEYFLRLQEFLNSLSRRIALDKLPTAPFALEGGGYRVARDALDGFAQVHGRALGLSDLLLVDGVSGRPSNHTLGGCVVIRASSVLVRMPLLWTVTLHEIVEAATTTPPLPVAIPRHVADAIAEANVDANVLTACARREDSQDEVVARYWFSHGPGIVHAITHHRYLPMEEISSQHTLAWRLFLLAWRTESAPEDEAQECWRAFTMDGSGTAWARRARRRLHKLLFAVGATRDGPVIAELDAALTEQRRFAPPACAAISAAAPVTLRARKAWLDHLDELRARWPAEDWWPVTRTRDPNIRGPQLYQAGGLSFGNSIEDECAYHELAVACWRRWEERARRQRADRLQKLLQRQPFQQ